MSDDDQNRPTFKLGSENEIAKLVIQSLNERYLRVFSVNHILYGWDVRYWREIPKALILNEIKSFDGRCPQIAPHRPIKISNRMLKAVWELIHESAENEDGFKYAAPGIPFSNKFLALDGDGLKPEPHDEALLNRYNLHVRWPLPRKYDPDEKSLLLNTYLEGSFKGDPEKVEKTKVLQEVAGAVILGGSIKLSSRKAILLFGPLAANGKSQFLEILRGLIPDHAQASLSPRQLCDERLICDLDGKVLNAADEIGDKSIASENLKAAISKDPITARPIYKKAIRFVPIAQHVFTTNSLPTFIDGLDHGVRRRFRIVHFARTIPENERMNDIGREIAELELPQLIDWAVGGALRLIRQGKFTEIPSSDEIISMWARLDDPIGSWLSDCAEVTGNPDHRWDVAEAYASFCQWCVVEKIRARDIVSRTKFSQVFNQGKYGEIGFVRGANQKLLTGLTPSQPRGDQ
nr:phage/plasmid primase, P4 family [Hyphomonas sp. Mor2]